MPASAGPWEFFRNTYGYSITCAQGWEIARLPLSAVVANQGRRLSQLELPARKNACLIAAAPALLSALSDLYDRRTPESMALAREAMNQAKGE